MTPRAAEICARVMRFAEVTRSFHGTNAFIIHPKTGQRKNLSVGHQTCGQPD